MKYSNSIIIDLPIHELVEKFLDSDNINHWQPGFISIEALEGDKGEVGSTSKMKYLMGKREVELVETIKEKDLPNLFHATYTMKGTFNKNENYFKVIDSNKTEWTSKVEFRFTGLMMQILGFIMPGSFKKQSYQYMKNFKAFVERGESVA